MLPDPLHPAVVHLPIALAILVPLVAIGTWLAIRSGALPERSWALVAALQILFAGSAWVAFKTGENEEERVERVVAEEHIEAHEEAAERLAIAASVVAVLIAAGLLPDRIGRTARALGTLGSLGVIAAAVAAGHSGGELVYRHGAASAYTEPGAQAGAPAQEATP